MNLPDYFLQITHLISVYVQKKVDHWTLQTQGGDYEFGPYVQGLIEFDGSIHLEVTGNEYLRPELPPEKIEALRFLGWETKSEIGLPNFWFTSNSYEGVGKDIGHKLCQTLYTIYGVNDTFTFNMSPHPKDVGIPAASLIYRGETNESK